MQTALSATLRDTPTGREADRILRSCVHCGFCNATCPTFQLLGDERDGPRGRIYLIKEMLESGTATRQTQQHLDRCLTCRACETTCPSGVQYHRLLEIGRAEVELRVRRSWLERFKRTALLRIIPEPSRFRSMAALARWARPLLPAGLKKAVPAQPAPAATWPGGTHSRKVLLLQGCVQSVAAPGINQAAAVILDRLAVQALPAGGCCGALSHHLAREEQTLATARSNIDNWWPLVESGAEAIILTASGCAPTVMDYGRMLERDPVYAAKAGRIAALATDISGFLAKEDLASLEIDAGSLPAIAFHAPCTLQHGLKRPGAVEGLLEGLGFRLTRVPDAHLCCGSAGTYSVLQPQLSQRLLSAKMKNLLSGGPALIATANIGCLMHLKSGTDLPVLHWIELLAGNGIGAGQTD